jgi:hypothetical protein
MEFQMVRLSFLQREQETIVGKAVGEQGPMRR